MKISKVDTIIAVYNSMRKLGRDAIVRKEWAAAEAYGRSYLRLVQQLNDELLNETERTVHRNGGEDRAQS